MEKTEKRKSEVLKKQRVIWTITMPAVIVALTIWARAIVIGKLDLDYTTICLIVCLVLVTGSATYGLFSINITEWQIWEEKQLRYKGQLEESDGRRKMIKECFTGKLVYVKILHDKNFVESSILEQVESMFSFYYFASMQDNKVVIYIKNENHETIGKPIYISDLDEFWKIFDFQGKSEYK